MKKTFLSAAFIASSILCASENVYQEIDHSQNLMATYEMSSGRKINFDLDQCSRLGALIFIAGGYVKSNVVAKIGLTTKIVANIKMAGKEFDQDETARGYEHFVYFVPSLHILLSKKQAHDRLYMNRVSKLLMPIIIGIPMYLINEIYSFAYDLSDGKYPISFE